MNLHEALRTANWLLHREIAEDGHGDPERVLAIRNLRDTIYFLHAAAGVHEIVVKAREGILPDEMP